MTKRVKLTLRQIGKYNIFLDSLVKSTRNRDLARLYASAKIKRAKIGQTVLKGQCGQIQQNAQT